MTQHVIVGAGTIGNAVARILADDGHDVRMVTRSGSGPVHPAVERVAADATDAPRLTELTRGAAVLYNCANPPYHRWSTDWPPLAAALLTAAERAGAVLVTMANLYGYGPVDAPMTEDTPLRSAPGTKGAVRNRMWLDALAAHESGRVRVTEARASDFYGPGIRSTGHLGEQFVPRLLAGRRPRLMQGDLGAPHAFTHVDDVARTLVTLGADDRAWGRPWHVPTDRAVSVREIATRLARIAGVPDRGVQVLPGSRSGSAGWPCRSCASSPRCGTSSRSRSCSTRALRRPRSDSPRPRSTTAWRRPSRGGGTRSGPPPERG